MVQPIYTPANCNPAYQLDWSYAVFWRETPRWFTWLEQLQAASEVDGIRILQHQFDPPNVSKFLVSTKPHVAPHLIVQRLKGRLQNLVRRELPKAFRRNYSLRSIGSTRRERLEKYIAGQVEHHPMADPRVMQRLKQYQVDDPNVDLSQPSHSAHAQYWYNLHIVLVNDWRWMEIRDEVLSSVRDIIVGASEKKGHLLARGAILPDHVHLALRCGLEESPEDVALSYMNNIAFACGMTACLKYSYFVGTFSEYDLGVIPRA